MTRNSLSVLTGLFFVALVSADCSSQPSKQKNTELDFMIGEWEAEAKIKVSPEDYITGKGTIKAYYTGDILLADMNIKFEEFDVIGTTKRLYKPERKLWEISWNPENPEDGEPNIDGQMKGERFVEYNYGKDANGPYIGRLIIYNISNDHFSVRKDRLYDNGRLYPEIWTYEASRKK